MGTIVQRKRKNGSTAYRAQIVRKQGKKIVYRETQSFDRKQAAKAWLDRRETELREPGAITLALKDPPLREAIDRYIKESAKIGRTKKQVLETIRDKHDIAEKKCSEIKTEDLVAFAQSLQVKPQTRQNYLSHLGAVFTVARPAWGYRLDRNLMKDVLVVTRKLGITRKSDQRDRRPTIDELDKIMELFGRIRTKKPSSAPMQAITVFAIFSTRRQEEITRISWKDYDTTRILVRDMKHPGEKIGNDAWCELPPEAAVVVESLPRVDGRIFPFTTDAISAAWTRACQFLEIEDLHFHDLPHDGVSRLFEMGKTIPQAASVSGHRSWASLKRYTHLRQTGDKYEKWKWKISLPTDPFNANNRAPHPIS